MPNRLATSTSPYLLQHQNNPVDWFPWGEEAFARARQEDKPIFLSVGYSSCHWCHVMEHESFEDEEVAQALNEGFVCIKLDREERPDIDEAYMTAVQLTSGRGGWPMSVFLTPDLKPFFAGTYFPKEDRGKSPGFLTLVKYLGGLWRSNRGELVETADGIAEEIERFRTSEVPAHTGVLDQSTLAAVVEALGKDFDPRQGGFGGAPKFPPHTTLQLFLELGLKPVLPAETLQKALQQSLITLQKMALGGIHDHVGGGFHRYSTDARWLLPHFEKMLYDNALMLGNYARALRLLERSMEPIKGVFRRASSGIVRWLRDEMTSPEGFFYSALDADSEGEEGKFYVWTEAEVRELLGQDADAFLQTYRFEAEGNFEDEATQEKTGANIPHLLMDDGGRFEAALTRLREARESRIRPGLDDKAIAAWNGLMISALVEAGELEMASQAGRAWRAATEKAGYLPHQVTKGRFGGQPFLDDVAGMALAYLDLADATGDPEWRLAADNLADQMVADFGDGEGGFFGTSDAHERLFGRARPVFDQPAPSGCGLAARVLVRLGEEESGRKAIRGLAGYMVRAPQATETLWLALLELLTGKRTQVTAEPAKPVSPPAPEPPKGVPTQLTATLEPRRLKADASRSASAVLTLEIPEGLHLNSTDPPARWLTPTRLTCEPVRVDADWPEPEALGYYGTVRIPLKFSLPAGMSGTEFELKLTFQACSETACMPPDERRIDGILEQA